MAFLSVTLNLAVMSFDINSLQSLRYCRSSMVTSKSQGLHHNNCAEINGARQNMNGDIKELSGLSAAISATTCARDFGKRKRKNSPTHTNLNAVKRNSRELCSSAQICISGSGAHVLESVEPLGGDAGGGAEERGWRAQSRC